MNAFEMKEETKKRRREASEYLQSVDLIEEAYNEVVRETKDSFFRKLYECLPSKIVGSAGYDVWCGIEEYAPDKYLFLNFYLKNESGTIKAEHASDELRNLFKEEGGVPVGSDRKPDRAWKRDDNRIGWVISDRYDKFSFEDNLKDIYIPPMADFLQNFVDDVIHDFKPIIEEVAHRIKYLRTSS